MTTMTDRLAAIEAMRPEAVELASLIQSGHDLDALSARIVDLARRFDQAESAFRESVVAHVKATGAEFNWYFTESSADDAGDGATAICGAVSGSTIVYEAINRTGYNPDQLMMHGLVMTEAEAEALTDARWADLLTNN